MIALASCTPKLPFDNFPGRDNNDKGNGNDKNNKVSIANPHKGHEWVDLGLSVYWSTCNMGAKTEEQKGDYYAWGEIEPQAEKTFTWDSYKWYFISGDALTKYNLNSKYGDVDNKAILDDADDAAHVKWEGDWYMPTTEEILELVNNCTWKKKNRNGVAGYEGVSKKNGKSIFFPCNGAYSDGKLQNEEYPTFWSCELDNSGEEDDSLFGFCFMMGKYESAGAAYTRFCGLAIRPVIPLDLDTKAKTKAGSDSGAVKRASIERLPIAPVSASSRPSSR